MSEDGSSYAGNYETFATAAPLPVTDLAVHPDGALYFTIGGRRTQSALYRIRYTGATNAMGTEEDLNQPTGLGRIAKRIRNLGPLIRSEQRTEKAQMRQASQLRKLRQRIEATHLAEPSEESLQLAISNLGHSDRGIRFASHASPWSISRSIGGEPS